MLCAPPTRVLRALCAFESSFPTSLSTSFKKRLNSPVENVLCVMRVLKGGIRVRDTPSIEIGRLSSCRRVVFELSSEGECSFARSHPSLHFSRLLFSRMYSFGTSDLRGETVKGRNFRQVCFSPLEWKFASFLSFYSCKMSFEIMLRRAGTSLHSTKTKNSTPLKDCSLSSRKLFPLGINFSKVNVRLAR